MPALVARAHEERGPADRPADQPLVDALARGLVGAAKKRVGRAADAQALGFGGVDKLPRLGDGDAERLLRMDVLAGGDRLEADLDMRLRDGEVENDLDRRIARGPRRPSRAGMPNSAARASAAAGLTSASATMSRIGNFLAAFR